MVAIGSTKHRNYIMTQNNPEQHGLSDDLIKEKLMLKNPVYFCMARERSTTGTEHIHVYECFRSPMMFSTLKNVFPYAHIEPAYGSPADNRDYITKSGKWALSDKAETIIPGTFYEYGEMPISKDKTVVRSQLIAALEAGETTSAIVKANPEYSFRVREIDTLRDTLLSEKFSKEKRDVCCIYIFGPTGTGKTHSVYERHDASDICRISSYDRASSIFDPYKAHPVLCLDEYRGQIEISALLSYLDIYPIFLPARYYDRVACYNTVYIISNEPLNCLYQEIQVRKPETWRAFLRRIRTIREYTGLNQYKEYTPKEGGLL